MLGAERGFAVVARGRRRSFGFVSDCWRMGGLLKSADLEAAGAFLESLRMK